MPQRLSFGTIIHRLLNEELTTVNELGEITGRGTSTIYRWMNDESEPHFWRRPSSSPAPRRLLQRYRPLERPPAAAPPARPAS